MKETTNTTAPKATATANVNKTFEIIREPFISKNNGEQYYSYFVKGKVRGRDIKVDFAPKDIGGYEPLDIVFDNTDKAELVIGSETMTNENGEKVTFATYIVQNVDENGEIWACPVRPSRTSDKTLLEMLLKTVKTA